MAIQPVDEERLREVLAASVARAWEQRDRDFPHDDEPDRLSDDDVRPFTIPEYDDRA